VGNALKIKTQIPAVQYPGSASLAQSLAQRLANGAEFGAMKAAKSGTIDRRP